MYRLIEALKKMQIRWLPVIAAAAVMLTLFAWGMARNAADIREASRREADLQVERLDREEALSTLKAKAQDVGSTRYVETRARSELGYLKPGEIRFVVTNPELLDSYTEEEWQIRFAEMALEE